MVDLSEDHGSYWRIRDVIRMIRRYDLDDWEDPKRDRNRSYSVHDVRELLAD